MLLSLADRGSRLLERHKRYYYRNTIQRRQHYELRTRNALAAALQVFMRNYTRDGPRGIPTTSHGTTGNRRTQSACDDRAPVHEEKRFLLKLINNVLSSRPGRTLCSHRCRPSGDDLRGSTNEHTDAFAKI